MRLAVVRKGKSRYPTAAVDGVEPKFNGTKGLWSDSFPFAISTRLELIIMNNYRVRYSLTT